MHPYQNHVYVIHIEEVRASYVTAGWCYLMRKNSDLAHNLKLQKMCEKMNEKISNNIFCECKPLQITVQHVAKN